jgi:hypothetical protein
MPRWRFSNSPLECCGTARNRLSISMQIRIWVRIRILSQFYTCWNFLDFPLSSTTTIQKFSLLDGRYRHQKEQILPPQTVFNRSRNKSVLSISSSVGNCLILRPHKTKRTEENMERPNCDWKCQNGGRTSEKYFFPPLIISNSYPRIIILFPLTYTKNILKPKRLQSQN